MEPRQISLSATAYSDLEDIENYISQDSPAIARQFINRIFDKIEQLDSYPESGKIVNELRENRIRELFLKKYRIVYQILNSKEIVVLRIIHGSRLLDLEAE